MWYWRRVEITWTESEKNEEVLHEAKGERNTVYIHTIKQRKANRTGHFLRRNDFLKHVIKGKTVWMGGRGKRRKQLLVKKYFIVQLMHSII
jgi:uncharacterized C2H2 Zn-finger protein